MSERWVCKICIALHGLKASDLDKWPEVGDYAGIALHLREVHQLLAPEHDIYRDPSKPERNCDFCGKPYRGPAVYCSLACAVADA